MIEPLTDAEIEKMKDYYFEGEGEGDGNADDCRALIAEVERLKDNRRLWVSEADRYMRERDKLKEENAKLKEAHHKISVEYERVRNEAWFGLDHDELTEENAKLKTQLEAALKRIEEME